MTLSPSLGRVLTVVSSPGSSCPHLPFLSSLGQFVPGSQSHKVFAILTQVTDQVLIDNKILNYIGLLQLVKKVNNKKIFNCFAFIVFDSI